MGHSFSSRVVFHTKPLAHERFLMHKERTVPFCQVLHVWQSLRSTQRVCLGTFPVSLAQARTRFNDHEVPLPAGSGQLLVLNGCKSSPDMVNYRITGVVRITGLMNAGFAVSQVFEASFGQLHVTDGSCAG